MMLAFVGFVALLQTGAPADGEAPGMASAGRSAGQVPGRDPTGTVQKVASVRVVTMTPAVATRYDVRYREGVLVTAVTPSDGSGTTLLLRRLDLILTVNGDPVTDDRQLRDRLDTYRSSQWVELIVLREGRLIPVRVPVEAFGA